MKKTFLQHVAEDLIRRFGNDFSQVMIITPNKRASLFLNDALAAHTDCPVWTPTYMTITELFDSFSPYQLGDEIRLITILHDIYTRVTGLTESLDHFYAWGKILITDFDDIDKHLADAQKVFKNLADLHELDDLSYLNQEQKQIIKLFFSNFSEDQDTALKQQFIRLWQNLHTIYTRYLKAISEQNILYEGALCRDVIQNERIQIRARHCAFIGFNLLLPCEEALFSYFKEHTDTLFYWDYDKYYMDDTGNEAGFYIRKHTVKFPNALPSDDPEVYDNFGCAKSISYVSANTHDIQARYLSTWLSDDPNRIADGNKTAVVLCDETLLRPVMHSIIPEVTRTNVTLGYPLSQTPVMSLVASLLDLRAMGYAGRDDKYRLKYVTSVLSHPYLSYMSQQASGLSSQLQEQRCFYPTPQMLCVDEPLTQIFDTADLSANGPSPGKSQHLLTLITWLLRITECLGKSVRDSQDIMLKESVFRLFTLLGRVHELIIHHGFEVEMTTFKKLMLQWISGVKIPFHGEPAVGLQVMGVLETRCMDFEHLLILDCNEGNMPKGIHDNSFIPYQLRKAYGLTTIDHKVALFSYHFQRLIQRCPDVTIVYGNSQQGGKTAEMSRFMLQMMVESDHEIRHFALQAGQKIKRTTLKPIPKTPEILSILINKKRLSPTALGLYLRCPVRFYYQEICGIRERQEEEGGVDARVFGNIFHASAQHLYMDYVGQKRVITADVIGRMLNDNVRMSCIVDDVMAKEIFNAPHHSVKNHYTGNQIICRKVILDYLRKLLKLDAMCTPFYILGLEQEIDSAIVIRTSQGTREITLGGIIDRVDMTIGKGSEQIRVVDYKTGKKQVTKIKMEELFDPTQVASKHTDYYLQTMLYALWISRKIGTTHPGVPVGPGLLFIQRVGEEDFNPILRLDEDRLTDITCVEQPFMEGLTRLISEIYEPQKDFIHTEDEKRCLTCPFNIICNR